MRFLALLALLLLVLATLPSCGEAASEGSQLVAAAGASVAVRAETLRRRHRRRLLRHRHHHTVPAVVLKEGIAANPHYPALLAHFKARHAKLASVPNQDLTFFRVQDTGFPTPVQVVNGMGASFVGGRWNPQNMVALYGSERNYVALAESSATNKKKSEAGDLTLYARLIVRVEVKGVALLDLTDAAHGEPGPELADALKAATTPASDALAAYKNEKWADEQWEKKRESITQAVGRAVRDAGFGGMTVNSHAVAGEHGLKNFIIFPEVVQAGGSKGPRVSGKEGLVRLGMLNCPRKDKPTTELKDFEANVALSKKHLGKVSEAEHNMYAPAIMTYLQKLDRKDAVKSLTGTFFRFHDVSIPVSTAILEHGTYRLMQGGEYNPAGLAAIYLSETEKGALDELESANQRSSDVGATPDASNLLIVGISLVNVNYVDLSEPHFSALLDTVLDKAGAQKLATDVGGQAKLKKLLAETTAAMAPQQEPEHIPAKFPIPAGQSVLRETLLQAIGRVASEHYGACAVSVPSKASAAARELKRTVFVVFPDCIHKLQHAFDGKHHGHAAAGAPKEKWSATTFSDADKTTSKRLANGDDRSMRPSIAFAGATTDGKPNSLEVLTTNGAPPHGSKAPNGCPAV